MRWLVLGACVALVACKEQPSQTTSVAADAAPSVAADAAPSVAADAARTARVWVDKLSSEADFEAYSKQVGGERFTKFVIDLKSNAIYYVAADIYPMHKDFIFAELLKTERTKEAVREFDKNYGKDKPSFLMGYLVHHLGPDLWTFAYWDGDKATAAHTELALRRLHDTFYLADRVKFRPQSMAQEEMAKGLGSAVGIVTNDTLYRASGYQLFHAGRAVGTLRLVAPGASGDALDFDRTDIVILPEPLADIGKVAGILSQTFSTPLAHVNLRAAAWGIPNVGLHEAATRYAPLVGKRVFFESRVDGVTLREATAEEVAAASAADLPAPIQLPPVNLGPRELTHLTELHATDASAYGAKTANLGEIAAAKLPQAPVPAGFGIPIAYYDAHLKSAPLAGRVAALLKDPALSVRASRKKKLAELRAAIRSAPLSPDLLAKVETELQALAGDGGAPPGVFVRSSTNAEDLPGFSGAGLYDTVPNVHGSKAIGEAIKQVWASVWNDAAFDERELYHIDHSRVYGAALLQIGVDATAAGVLVTAHPTDPNDRRSVTINAKSGLGIRVVNGKKLPEIVVYNTYNQGLRVLSRSDEDTMLVFSPSGGVREVPVPNKGQPVLTTERVVRLGVASRHVQALFPKDMRLDIEWLLRGDELFIVQARPYVVRQPAAEARAGVTDPGPGSEAP